MKTSQLYVSAPLTVKRVGDVLVNPEVRKNVNDKDFRECSLVSPESKSSEDQADSNVGNDDVPLVSSLEDDRRWGEVCLT